MKTKELEKQHQKLYVKEILKAVKKIDSLEIAGFCSHSVLTSLGHFAVIHGKKHHAWLFKVRDVHLCKGKTSSDVPLVTVPMFLPLKSKLQLLQFTRAAVGLSAIVPHCLLICPVAWLGDTRTHCCFAGEEVAGVALPSSSVLLILNFLALWYDSRKKWKCNFRLLLE